MRKSMFAGALIVVLSFALVGCGQKAGTAKDGNEQTIEAAAIDLATRSVAGGYDLVTVDDVKNWIDNKDDVVIIDTMPLEVYNKGHIPGAVQAELPREGAATEAQIEAFAKLLPEDKGTKIAVYCGFTSCNRSDVGAAYAIEQGYTDVSRIPGGIIAWKDAGFEVEK